MLKNSLTVKILIVLGIILVAIVLRFGYSAYTAHLRQKAMGKTKIPEVSVETIKEDTVIETFEAPGRVVSKYQVGIMARISGYLLKSYFKEGDFVKAGETLFLIEPREFQNASNIASANIENVKAQLEFANKQLKRAEELLKNDYISKAKYDEILANRNALSAQLKANQSNYNDTKRNLDYTEVKAPVDGRIGLISVTIGNYVSPATGSLTTINSTNPIYVSFPIQSDDYQKITAIDKPDEKRKVELYFKNGTKYEFDGVQDFIDNKIDLTTGTVTMRATFPNKDNKLLHGEFVNVKLYMKTPSKVPLVPVIAVQQNQEGRYVYVLDNENLPKLTYIKTENRIGDYWIVKDGLKVGDKVITEGIQKVVPQEPIKITNSK